MMYEVFIEGEKVDLDYGTDVPLTFQVFDVNSITNVMSNYTKTISIPKTPKNNEILGFPDTFESASRKIYSKLKVMVLKNGVEIISSRGLCFVANVSDHYELNIFYGNYAFFSDIENKSLTDIDTSDIDHNWNYAAINGSSLGGNFGTKDYVYPIMENGEEILISEKEGTDKGKYINLESLLPVISVRYILNKIIEESGYTYVDENNVLSYFDDKYISLVNILADDVVSYQITQAQALRSAWYNIHLYPIADGMYGAIYFNTISVNYFNQMQQRNYTDADTNKLTAYRVGCNCNLRFRVNFEIERFAVPGSATVNVCIVTHDGSVVGIDEETGLDYENYQILHSQEYDINSISNTDVDLIYEGLFTTNEYISVLVQVIDWPLGWAKVIRVNSGGFYTYEDPVENNSAEETGYGYHLQISRNLPQTSQVNFIKELLVIGGMVLTSNYYDKIIYFNSFDDVYKNIHLAKDWSNKINFIDSEININFIPSSYYKRNYFKYNDSIVTGESLSEVGKGYFDIDNQMLENSDHFYKSLFTEIRYVKRGAFNLKVLQVNTIDLSYNSTGALPRIMIVKEKTRTVPLSFESLLDEESFTEATVCFSFFINDDYIEVDLGVNDLSFQNIINNKYANLVKLLNNFKSVTLPVKLDDADVANFNHLIPVWISAFNSYFYVNKIPDYINGLTLVELIKIY